MYQISYLPLATKLSEEGLQYHRVETGGFADKDA